MDTLPCTICRETGHTIRKCPNLYDVLKEGFFSGGDGHVHDEDCEDQLVKYTDLSPYSLIHFSKNA